MGATGNLLLWVQAMYRALQHSASFGFCIWIDTSGTKAFGSAWLAESDEKDVSQREVLHGGTTC